MKQKNIFHILIATGFGSGYCPKAPGTAGAVLATVLWFGLSLLLTPYYLFIVTGLLILLFTGLGVWSSGIMEAYWGEDPAKVVIDEMVGVWIPLLAVSDGNVYFALVALLLFRLFDIFKPLGIRKMEAIKGGWGIMLDDILAGLYSLIILYGLRWLVGLIG
ncbi:MAG: phosphatidylglycerophosphatase A [Candidatus Azobacteroides sp.]|nr:phosphatidylglycerophosphatase A [Candidatus Azobacteroides sp.]